MMDKIRLGPQNVEQVLEEKSNMHPRNKHRFRYNFPHLIETCPELASCVSLNGFNQLSIDFSNPLAVKLLNQALLKFHYNIPLWDIPEGYLCPPIPGRADYLHYMADLLASCNGSNIPLGRKIKVLDIGVGANCIYPLIGTREYGWSFKGSDVDDLAIRSANNIIAANSLSDSITIRKQHSPQHIFSGVLSTKERFDLTICNPPFHSSAKEATAGTVRKWTNLKKAKSPTTLNFGGTNKELWCEGGEENFVKMMIEESVIFGKSVFWFSSLISSKNTLPKCKQALQLVKATDIRIINMSQGQKISRVLAWTFLNETEQKSWY